MTFTDVERIETGSGNDTIVLSDGEDSVAGGEGDDVFFVADNYNNDTLVGGEGGETVGDTLNGAPMTNDVTVNFNGVESGTLSSGGGTIQFSEFERIATGDGDDFVDGDTSQVSSGGTIVRNDGDLIIDTGAGNDTIYSGHGDDTIYAGDGNDEIFGGAGGADSIIAGAGDDMIAVFEDNDIDAGDGDDFMSLIVDVADVVGDITIVGGDADETLGGGDTLDFNDLADMSTHNSVSNGTNASGNETFSGSVTLLDGSVLTDPLDWRAHCSSKGQACADPHSSGCDDRPRA